MLFLPLTLNATSAHQILAEMDNIGVKNFLALFLIENLNFIFKFLYHSSQGDSFVLFVDNEIMFLLLLLQVLKFILLFLQLLHLLHCIDMLKIYIALMFHFLHNFLVIYDYSLCDKPLYMTDKLRVQMGKHNLQVLFVEVCEQQLAVLS